MLTVGRAGAVCIGHAEGDGAGETGAVSRGIVAGTAVFHSAQGGLVVGEGVGTREGEHTPGEGAADGARVGEAERVTGQGAGDGEGGPGDLGVIQIGQCETGLDGGGSGGLGVGKAAAGGNDGSIVDGGQRHLHLDGGAGGKRPVPGFHGERVGSAVGVGGRGPDQGFAGGQEGGAGSDRHPVFGEGPGGHRLDTEGKGVIFRIGLIGRRDQVGIADGVSAILGAASEIGDGGEGGSIVHGGDSDRAGTGAGLHAIGCSAGIEVSHAVGDGAGSRIDRGVVAGGLESDRPEHRLVVGDGGTAGESENAAGGIEAGRHATQQAGGWDGKGIASGEAGGNRNRGTAGDGGVIDIGKGKGRGDGKV